MDKRYIIITKEMVSSIDFSEVNEYNAETLRYSLDGEYTFVNYFLENGRPSVFDDTLAEYTQDQMLIILEGDNWKDDEI